MYWKITDSWYKPCVNPFNAKALLNVDVTEWQDDVIDVKRVNDVAIKANNVQFSAGWEHFDL